ncbi:hypothetical protein CTAYLR_009981 [Chrysophaeum taylorii]|uniref:Multicopper oxidase n=1 Tax=Chrysophaeum taylorii TaxID=2483200 RepID=A0AAD7UHZ8_9STRA|nr:hypothetical protein CTAYLR_009981 [Chrysophaeum taylorii]
MWLVGVLAGVRCGVVLAGELVVPEECATECVLRLGAVSVDVEGHAVRTRGYNGGVPGPIIRARAGERLRILVVNELNDDDNEQRGHNEITLPNVTNLHTHGLHYEYDIPASHMGGTHWYHPHHHGSVSLQAGGGAAGLLIVADEAGAVPPEVERMVEVPILLTYVDPVVYEFQGYFNRAFFKSAPPDGFLLTNSQVAPRLTVEIGTWYRARLCVNDADGVAVTLSMTQDTTGCEMHLLAKDGVYLPQAPREVVQLPMYAGARADVALRCAANGTASLGAAIDGRDFVALELVVPPAASDPAPDIPQFLVNRPCYLSDTRDAAVEPDVRLAFDVGDWDESFPEDHTYVGTLPSGSLVEVVTSPQTHPLHIHINHFQLTDVQAADANYWQDGDWADTLRAEAESATLRFYTNDFVGEMVVHCHNLVHEDEGMMQVFWIQGDASSYDPRCNFTPGFNYTRANSTSRIGLSLCCDNNNNSSSYPAWLLPFLIAVVVLLLAAGYIALRRRRRRRRRAAARRLDNDDKTPAVVKGDDDDDDDKTTFAGPAS